MTTRSPRTILTFSAALALTVAALAPTAALAKGPNGGSGDATCDGDCTADAPQAQQVRARDGSGVNQSTGTQANAGGGGQVRAGVADSTETQTWNANRGRNANANGNRANANANGQNSKSGAGQGPNEDGQRGPGTCDDCDVQMGTLTPEQEQGLIFMAEEEKLAHDVYAALAEQYDVPIFSNIANAEARHQAAVEVVLERYDIDASMLPEAAGEFYNELLGSLYTSLLEEGSASYEAALGVGVQIEALDIADLESRLAAPEDAALEDAAPDVFEMYSHLLAGSQNHLAAFEGRR
jgi:hypothetical protein